jgi:hypothetical protein
MLTNKCKHIIGAQSDKPRPCRNNARVGDYCNRHAKKTLTPILLTHDEVFGEPIKDEINVQTTQTDFTEQQLARFNARLSAMESATKSVESNSSVVPPTPSVSPVNTITLDFDENDDNIASEEEPPKKKPSPAQHDDPFLRDFRARLQQAVQERQQRNVEIKDPPRVHIPEPDVGFFCLWKTTK